MSGAAPPQIALLTQDDPGVLPLFGPPRWGVFSQDGQPILVAESVGELEFDREYDVSRYPQEGAPGNLSRFESYNKVQVPFSAKITVLSNRTRALGLSFEEVGQPPRRGARRRKQYEKGYLLARDGHGNAEDWPYSPTWGLPVRAAAASTAEWRTKIMRVLTEAELDAVAEGGLPTGSPPPGQDTAFAVHSAQEMEHRIYPEARRRFVERRGSAMLLIFFLALGLYRTIRS